MYKTTPSSRFHRRWQRGLTVFSSIPALACGHLQAQNSAAAAASATVQPNGVRTGVNGTNFFNVEGSSNGNSASFGVLDFSASAFNLSNSNVSGVQGSTISLTLTESNGTFTKAGPLEFYLTTNNSASIVAGTSTLKFQTATATDTSNSPYGIDPLLGVVPGSTAASSYSLFDLGSYTFTPQATNYQPDTYTLTLSTAAMQAFVNGLSSAGGGNIRLVIAGTSATTAATYAGATNSFPAERPMLSFTPTYSTANNLNWQAGSSTWTATGGTSWNAANSGTGNSAWNNDGTHSAVFAETTGSTVLVDAGINAAGIEFDTNGYVLNAAAAGNTLALSGSGPIIQVTNAADTATVNVALGGSTGFIKTGAGTLVLGGTNSYGGTTSVNAGTLSISSDANLGNGGAVALNGGTLQTTGSLTLARAISGSGGLAVAAGSTLTVSGAVDMGTLTLPGGGTVRLTNPDFNVSGTANGGFTGLNFPTAGANLQTQNAITGNTLGVVNLGTGGIVAAQNSGAVGVAANFQVAGTVPISVANAAATLNVSGAVSGAAVFAKTGAGTLVVNSDNQLLTGTGATPASFRQGTVGTTPVSGGVIAISASNPNPGAALGTAEFQANGGTLRNDTGAAITLTITDVSLGAPSTAAAPGGLIFAGSGGFTVTGPISLFKGTTNAYQHAITVNTPTTFSGVLTASANTTTSTGLTIFGSSTLTLNGTAPNTMKEPVTIATGGTGAGVLAATEGAFAATTAITLNAGASLTINTGAQSGTVNTINDGALLAFNTLAGAFGKLSLNIGSGQEIVGGLYLSANDGTLLGGYLPAGTYGSRQSTAQFQDDTLFSGSGMLVNLNVVPEPSAWAALGCGGLLGLAVLRRGHRMVCVV